MFAMRFLLFKQETQPYFTAGVDVIFLEIL
jgi:hypothetical protein